MIYSNKAFLNKIFKLCYIKLSQKKSAWGKNTLPVCDTICAQLSWIVEYYFTQRLMFLKQSWKIISKF